MDADDSLCARSLRGERNATRCCQGQDTRPAIPGYTSDFDSAVERDEVADVCQVERGSL